MDINQNILEVLEDFFYINKQSTNCVVDQYTYGCPLDGSVSKQTCLVDLERKASQRIEDMRTFSKSPFFPKIHIKKCIPPW